MSTITLATNPYDHTTIYAITGDGGRAEDTQAEASYEAETDDLNSSAARALEGLTVGELVWAGRVLFRDVRVAARAEAA